MTARLRTNVGIVGSRYNRGTRRAIGFGASMANRPAGIMIERKPVAFEPISLEVFNSYKPMRDPMIADIAEEVSWFRDSEESVIGVVLRDKTDDDWVFVALGRDERGRFRAIELAASIPTREEAESALKAVLCKHAASGEHTFPQGD